MIGEQIILFLRNKITYNINRLYWLLGYLPFVEQPHHAVILSVLKNVSSI